MAFDVDDIGFAGAQEDPLAALVFCAPSRVWLSIVDGRVLVRDGELTSVDVAVLSQRHNALARKLVRGER